MRKLILLLGAALLVSGPALASDKHTYKVTVTNITQGQTFTPILAAAHRTRISLFELGHAASDELATLAEGGDVGPLRAVLDDARGLVGDTVATEGLLGPGESVSFKIKGSRRFKVLSLAAMLIPTNDSFVAVDTVYLPRRYKSFTVAAYDAGSEVNDELCANIPGPFCGGEGYSEGSAEGFVHISNGVHGVGDLDDGMLDWKNPVALVVIRRID